MSASEFGKEAWVELFREIGLNEEQMHRWHGAFEARWPEAHRGFLEWLEVPEADIDRIRKASRGEWDRG